MALIPPAYFNTVVCIGIEGSDGKPSWSASGFFYGDCVDGEEGQSAYRVYLVTNRHVVGGRQKLLIRLNPRGPDPAVEYEQELLRDGMPVWFAPSNEQIDIALIHVDAPSLRKEGIEFDYFRSDRDVLFRSTATEMGVMEGDGVFCLGFPLGLVDRDRNYVIARQGAIARISDCLAGLSDDFLLDILIFPGNSGGPVIIRPEAVAIQGTSKIPGAYLLGVIRGYVPYIDIAYSVQTQKPRITFEENSGLAAAIPMDAVRDSIGEYLSQHGAARVAG